MINKNLFYRPLLLAAGLHNLSLDYWVCDHIVIIDRVALAKQGDNVLGSVRPSVCVSACLFVRALLFEPFDLWPWFLAWGSTLT